MNQHQRNLTPVYAKPVNSTDNDILQSIICERVQNARPFGRMSFPRIQALK